MPTDHVLSWNKVLDEVRKNLTPKHFNTWFVPIKPLQQEGHVLTLEVPNEFFLSHLETHFLQVLKDGVKGAIGPRSKIEYRIAMDDYKKPGIDRTKALKNEKEFQDANHIGIANPFVIPGIRKQNWEANLNPHYIFENFVEGHCNRVARQAGLQITSKPGELFNPLLVYGNVGLGKTHLLNAIGNALMKKYPKMHVLYLTSDKYTNMFIQAIRNNSTSDFGHYFQQVDVLIIDDIQYFSGKAGTQEIFFHLFNQMHQNRKQIIMGSDRAPKDLKEIDDRLISRFKWGASLELLTPDYETMMAILEEKLEEKEVELTQQVKELLCHNLKDNIREIEGVIVNIKLQSSLNGKSVSLELVKDILQSFSNRGENVVSIDAITRIVSEQTSIPVNSMLGKGRQRNIVQARQLAMYYSKKMTKKPLASIGSAFGGRDHSTVIYSCEAVENLMDTDKLFEELARKIERVIIKTLGIK
ncbi:MAG: chromosomal replication initiator protein DnaA [Saprospiraceae bacterium]|nr:chromosomal replication initiator protein DnaA [Saprospiraceae bacterium]MBK7811790.1 chromosomal replication initiator protein DnaA [Saprospiraceae bacterium]MBK9631796.1 chromosomal replication initiator protein DnaA [Saprospiraceae bacterium]